MQRKSQDEVEAEDSDFLINVAAEVKKARQKHGPMHSPHEAYAVILEELDEFWDEVRKQRANYDSEAAYMELIQIAAMACRAAADCCYRYGG